MKRYETRIIDNRDAAQMYEYMEARIEVLKRRILQLEAENEALRWNQCVEDAVVCEIAYAASA